MSIWEQSSSNHVKHKLDDCLHSYQHNYYWHWRERTAEFPGLFPDFDMSFFSVGGKHPPFVRKWRGNPSFVSSLLLPSSSSRGSQHITLNVAVYLRCDSFIFVKACNSYIKRYKPLVLCQHWRRTVFSAEWWDILPSACDWWIHAIDVAAAPSLWSIDWKSKAESWLCPPFLFVFCFKGSPSSFCSFCCRLRWMRVVVWYLS